MKQLGLIVNPMAGLGGRLGLKGSDGSRIQRLARKLGAETQVQSRAVTALKAAGAKTLPVRILTCSGPMGEQACLQSGVSPEVCYAFSGRESTARDTADAARIMVKHGVDLLVFAGGDGTARDIAGSIHRALPVLGIPGGVKMQSGVFACTPTQAGSIAAAYLSSRNPRTREAEVMDLDEEAFRQGTLSARLHALLSVPDCPEGIQPVKARSSGRETESIAALAEYLRPLLERSDSVACLGPGTTTRAIMHRCGLQGTLLGVDIVSAGTVQCLDAEEKDLLCAVQSKPAKIILSPIGGQGHVLGRGNQQISSEVLRCAGQDNLIIAASREKILNLQGRPLIVDTGDLDLDQSLSGYRRILVGYEEFIVSRIGKDDHPNSLEGV